MKLVIHICLFFYIEQREKWNWLAAICSTHMENFMIFFTPPIFRGAERAMQVAHARLKRGQPLA